MSKIHLCEFCGKIGASKTYVEGTEYSGSFYLCEHCSEVWEMYNIPGKNRGAFLNEVFGVGDLHQHGPKSSAITRDRLNWGFISICSCCSRKVGAEEGVNLVDELMMAPLIKKALPSKLKNDKFIYLCSLCMAQLQIKMVSLTPMDRLPLMINPKEFRGLDGDDWDFLNDELKGFISKRLQGLPLEEVRSLSSPKVLKCLDVSLGYVSEEDRLLFEKDGETGTSYDIDGTEEEDISDANPLIIAAYEHGYMIELDMEFPEGFSDFQEYMKKFGYSKKFCDIIYRAIDLKYDYIRFDTIGPKYQEFETSKKV